MPRVFFALCLLVLLGVSASAQQRVAPDAFFTPGTLGSGSRALVNLVKRPRLKDGQRVEQSCQALISSNHRLAKLQCRKATDENRKLHVALHSAARFANFRSAYILGDPVTIWIPFRVVASGIDGKTQLELFLGPENSDVVWPQMMFQLFDSQCEPDKSVAARVAMAADGTASIAGLQEEPLSEACIASMSAYFETLQFVPARQDGQWIGTDVDVMLYNPTGRARKDSWEAYMVL
ncbi:MAG: hypothetical protein AB8G16_18195 [Gammaproteobacteria bacterium]